MDIKIYTLTHKKFNVPPDPLYVPLQVGSEEKEDLGYLCDNTGENISALNCYYSELTGLYWIWKNDHETEYVGTCHYRRFLLNEQEKIFTKRELEEKLRSYDLITTKRVPILLLREAMQKTPSKRTTSVMPLRNLPMLSPQYLWAREIRTLRKHTRQ